MGPSANRTFVRLPRLILFASALAAFASLLPPQPVLLAQQQSQQPAQSQSSKPAQQPQPAAPTQAQPTQPGQPTQPAQPQSQAPAAPTAKIASESKIVTVPATVHDKKGQLVSTLTKDDFSLDEDGRSQAITYFAREKDLPLTVGLLVDTSMSQRSVLTEERNASSTFIDQGLREDKKDQAFLIHFDKEVELLQDLTTSRQKLQSAMKLLEIADYQRTSDSDPDSSDPDSGGRGGSQSGYHHGGTHLYDAVYLACNELMLKQQGRKAIIVLTDGVDRGSKESLSLAIEAAQRANTVVYSIYFKGQEPNDYAQQRHHGGWSMGGPGGPGGGGGYPPRRYPQQEQRPDGKKILERLSKETGGRMYEVSKKHAVDDIYSEIEQEFRSQYILGFVPDAADKNDVGGEYHHIHLNTKDKNLTVQARDGYYAQPPSSTSPAAAPVPPPATSTRGAAANSD
jgi:VWFA-related protein